jgi:hypothetical protein
MKIQGTDISMIRGDSESITLSLKRDDVIIPFNQGDTVYFTVKQGYSTEKITLQKIITEFDEGGNCIIEIEPEDTKELSFGSYVYDIQLTDSNGRVTTIIPCSKFVVAEEVTYD